MTTLLTWPSSPVWANLNRKPSWNENISRYDSGLFQGATNWVRPLHEYIITGKNAGREKQSSLYLFVNSLKGMATPFRIKDPYDYQFGAVVQPTSSNMTSGDGFYVTNDFGWRSLPDESAHVFFDASSPAALVESTHYVTSYDNGFVTVLGPVSSQWTSSMEYFRKAHMAQPYEERSTIWNQFTVTIIIQEIPPS